MEHSKGNYMCNICEMVFTNQGTYWTHMNRKKNACMSKERCIEIMNENKEFELKTKLQEQELQKKKEENEKLKELLSKVAKDDELNNMLDKKLDKILSNKEQLEDKITNLLSKNVETLGLIKNTIENQPAPVQIQNNTQNNLDRKMAFEVNFTENGQEYVGHIDINMMKSILNHNNFNDSLKHATKAVFFHPLVPQNWKWCVTDKLAHYGVLMFRKTSNTVIKGGSIETINDVMRQAMYQVTDLLKEMSTKNPEFNETQKRNIEKMFGTLGVDFTSEQINNIKVIAYEGRNVVKSMWDSLYIPVETHPTGCRIRSKK